MGHHQSRAYSQGRVPALGWTHPRYLLVSWFPANLCCWWRQRKVSKTKLQFFSVRANLKYIHSAVIHHDDILVSFLFHTADACKMTTPSSRYSSMLYIYSVDNPQTLSIKLVITLLKVYERSKQLPTLFCVLFTCHFPYKNLVHTPSFFKSLLLITWNSVSYLFTDEI